MEKIHTTLPAKYYNDPDHFKKETEHFFANRWTCVGRADEVPLAGDFVKKELLGESLLVVRGKDSKVRTFYNICRHRGTQLCQKDKGKFLGSIQCPYHAWTYNLEGKLSGAPHMSETKGFLQDDWPLHQALTEIWEGNVFISLSKNPMSLGDQLGEMETKFANWRMGDLRLGKRIVYDIKANWKLIVQNYSECLHCPVIHPALAKLSNYLSGDNDPAEGSMLGGKMSLAQGCSTMTLSGKSARLPLPHLTENEKRHVYYYALLPNLLLSPHPDYVMTHTIWPLAFNQTQVICEFHFLPEEMAKPGFSAEDAVEFWDLTNKQDWEVSEWSQKGLQSRAYSPGPYSHRESLLHDLDCIVSRELN